jgi:hypothetical protein
MPYPSTEMAAVGQRSAASITEDRSDSSGDSCVTTTIPSGPIENTSGQSCAQPPVAAHSSRSTETNIRVDVTRESLRHSALLALKCSKNCLEGCGSDIRVAANSPTSCGVRCSFDVRDGLGIGPSANRMLGVVEHVGHSVRKAETKASTGPSPSPAMVTAPPSTDNWAVIFVRPLPSVVEV